ncbi:MAG TPA: hypothetical protein VK470_17295 [Bacteroidota bacterium]|nr:hypothetical protein [Bacteroidota bacterium]
MSALKQLVDILWFKLASWRKLSPSSSGMLPFRKLFTLLVYAAFAVGAVMFSRFVTWYLLDYVRIGLFLYHRFIAIVLFVFFLTVSAGNVVVSFATLYRSPEMSFLLSNPIPHATIFVVKFLDNFFYSSGTLFLASFAVLLGYGSYFNFAWYFYPMYLCCVLVPCMLIAGSLAVILLLLMMKLAATIPFKTVIGGVAVLYAVQIVVYFTLTNPVSLVKEIMLSYPFINAYYGSIDPPVTRMLPNYWAAQVLYFWITDFTPGLIANIALCMLTSLGCFTAAVLLGGRYFYETWLTSLTIHSSSVGRRDGSLPMFHFERPSRLSPHIEAILKKEYWLFVRDPSQWIHAAVMAVLLVVFLASAGTMEFKIVSSDLRAVIFLVIFVFNAFLISSIALRFVFPLMSLEGRAYWSVRSAPIRPSSLYWIKYVAMTSMLVALGIVIWAASTLPYRAIPCIPETSLAIIISVAVAASSLNSGMGSLYADFSEKNPIRLASSQGATMTFLFTMTLLAAVVALYFYPVLSIFITHFAGRPVTAKPVVNAVLLIASLSFVVSILAHWAGVRALKNDF